MNKQDKDTFDKIDEYFSNLNVEDIAKKIDDGVKNISKEISSSIQESLKNMKLDNSSSQTNHKNESKPYFSNVLHDVPSRVSYVLESIQNADRSSKMSPSFREGYFIALDDIRPLIYEGCDLEIVSKRIKEQIREVRLHSTNYKKSYCDGYVSGCEYVIKAMNRSKQLMMKRIIQEL